MKLRTFFMAVMAGAALLVGCNKEVDFGPAKVALDQTNLAFEVAGGSQAVSLTATRDWAVNGVPEWVAVSATNGQAAVEAQPLKITVTQNTAYDRSATLVFTIGFARTSLIINQAGPNGQVDNGDGTLENPYNVTGVIEYLNELGADVNSPKKVFVKGKVSALASKESDQFGGTGNTFGNGSFTMSDDGSVNGGQFTAYRINYLGNKKFAAGDTPVAVGDEVIVYGNVVNYKGNTPETQQNQAFLYSLNGENRGGVEGGSGETGEAKGTGTAEDPFNVAGAINAVKDLTWTSTTEYDKVGPYYVKGIVKSVTEAYGTQYGNGTFYIKDAETDNEFYVYRALYLGNKKFTANDTQIAEGDEVVIYGELMNYRGNTPETVQNSCYLYSLNGNTGSGDTPGDTPGETGEAKGTGTQVDPFNVAGAINAVKNLTWTSNTEYDKVGPYYVKGIVKSIKEAYGTQYGNGTFYIKDAETDNEFYVYRALYLGNKKFADGDTALAEGDEVVIYGELMNYRGNTPETVQNSCYLYSLNGKTSIEQTPVFGVAKTEISVAATATTATINVTGNVVWTATSTDVTLDVDEGEGAKAITATFDANTDTENAKTYTVKVSTTADVTTKEYTVTITQAKASSGNETVVSVDFIAQNNDLPQGSGNKLKDGTYTLGGQTFVMHAADGFYQGKSGANYYLLIGKKDSYIQLPAITGKALTKISFKTGEQASTSVIVDVTKDGTALNVNTSALNKGTEYSWDVAGEAGVAYRLQVMSAHNAQFQYLELKYE